MTGTGEAGSTVGVDRGAHPTTGGSRRGVHVFSSPEGQPRFRRATDVLLLVPALIGLVLLIVAYPPRSLEHSLQTFLSSIPGWLDPVWGFLYDLLGAWAIGLVVVTIVARRRSAALDAVGAFGFAWALAFVSTRLAVGHWPAVGGSIWGGSSSPEFPAVRVAEARSLRLRASLTRRRAS